MSLTAALAAVTLSGCMTVDFDVEIHDDVVSGTYVMAFDEEFMEDLDDEDPDEFLDDFESEAPFVDSGTIEDYAEDGNVGRLYSFEDVTFDEFSDEMNEGFVEEFVIERVDDEYKVNIMLGDSADDELPDMDLDLGIVFEIAVTFPGDVTQHNGELSNDGRTVTWDMIDAAEDGEDLHAAGSANSAVPTWVWILAAATVAAALFVVGLVWLARPRRRVDAPPAETVTSHDGLAGAPVAVNPPPSNPQVAASPAAPPVDQPNPWARPYPLPEPPPDETPQGVRADVKSTAVSKEAARSEGTVDRLRPPL